MLVLSEMTAVKLDHVQIRTEHHGEALVPAIDLSVTLKGNNRIFDMIHPDLREGLYTDFDRPPGPKGKEGQESLDLPVDELPNIRFSRLKYPLKWDNEQTGMTCTVDYGLGGNRNIVLNLATVKDFKTTPIEGGSGELKFTISSAADIDEKIAGKLGMQQQREIKITLLPPVDGAGTVVGQELDEGKPWPFPGDGADKDGKAPDATDLFVAGAKAETAAKTTAKKPAAKRPAGKKATAKKGGKRGG